MNLPAWIVQRLMSISYFKNIDSLFSPLYLPNDQDILHSSIKTIGTVENRLKLGKVDCLITDVAGTRASRKKWVNVFNGALCVIFTAPLSGYDQCLSEDWTAVNTLLPEALLLNRSHNLLNFHHRIKWKRRS